MRQRETAEIASLIVDIARDAPSRGSRPAPPARGVKDTVAAVEVADPGTAFTSCTSVSAPVGDLGRCGPRWGVDLQGGGATRGVDGLRTRCWELWE